jgi:hypothetical protein
MIFYTLTKIKVSKSKTVLTREWVRKGSKYIWLQNFDSKLYVVKIYFSKILFGDISHQLCSDNAFKALKDFQLPNSISIHLEDDYNKTWSFLFPSQF